MDDYLMVVAPWKEQRGLANDGLLGFIQSGVCLRACLHLRLRTLQHFDQPQEILPRHLLDARGLCAARIGVND